MKFYLTAQRSSAFVSFAAKSSFPFNYRMSSQFGGFWFWHCVRPIIPVVRLFFFCECCCLLSGARCLFYGEFIPIFWLQLIRWHHLRIPISYLFSFIRICNEEYSYQEFRCHARSLSFSLSPFLCNSFSFCMRMKNPCIILLAMNAFFHYHLKYKWFDGARAHTNTHSSSLPRAVYEYTIIYFNLHFVA